MTYQVAGPRGIEPTDVIDVPAEQLFRHGRTLRYERGSAVYATDGIVGRLRHVVVDESAGEAIALVVQVAETGHEILLPLQAVVKTAGSAVYLTGSCQQFSDWVLRAPRYQRKHAAKASLKALLNERVRYGKDPRRTVLQAGRDFLETAAAPPWTAPARPPLALAPPSDYALPNSSAASAEPASSRERSSHLGHMIAERDR
jgi:hypothetical protein